MKANLKLVTFLAVTLSSLISCSNHKSVASTLPIEQSSIPNQITLDEPRAIRFQLPNEDWKITTSDGITCLVSPTGSKIYFLDENAGEATPESRTGLLLDSYSEISSTLGEGWIKAETQVISINKPIGSLPTTNILWIANKAGKELAVLHFYQKGKIFTIRVEGAENTARENLVALVSGANIH